MRAVYLLLPLIAFSATATAERPVRTGPSPAMRVASAAYAAADRAFTAGDFMLARTLTRELTEKYPDDPASWLRLAQLEQRLGAFHEALAAYDSALDVEAAYSVDGGVTLAKIRYARATLLVTEARRELEASRGQPLGAPLDAQRQELARLLAQGDVLVSGGRIQEPPVKRDRRPARGYVVETKARETGK